MLRKLIVSMVLLLTITTFATAEVYLNDPLPKDGKANVSLLTDISVRYSSSLGGDEVIEFYNFVDNRYQTGIGSCTANNGSRCNISLEGLQPNKQYRWIAVVNKSGNLTFSDVWQFTTEREGSPPSVVPPLSYNESEDRPVFTVYSVVRDLEGGDNIRRCTLTAEDEDGNTNSYNMTLDDTYGNRSKAICRTEVSLYDNTGWRPEELLELAITVEDKDNNIKTFQDSYSTPDVTNSSSFAPLDPSPEDGELNVSLVPTLSAVYQDPEGESGVLRFYNATGYNIGLCSADSGNRCGVKGQELEPGTVYRWYVVADDGNNTVRSSKWSFKTVSRGKKEFNQTNQTKEVNQKDQTDQTQETEGPAEQSKGIRGKGYKGSELLNSKPPKIVGGPSVEGYNQRRSFNVSAVVEDANGDDNIRGCNLIILDEEGTIDNYDMRIERKYDGGKQALCNYNEISVDTNENWESGEVLRLNVTVLDNAGLLDSETVYYKLREGVVEEKSYETVSRDINSASRPFIMLILSIVILSIGIAVIVRYEVLKRKGRVVQE